MEKTNQTQTPAPQTQKRPNEVGAIGVAGFIKIFDPNTKEKFVEQKA